MINPDGRDMERLRRLLHVETGDLDPDDVDGLSKVLLRMMWTDPDTNVLLGNIPQGEAEDWAAAMVFAIHSDSDVALDYERLRLQAKRAEKGNFLNRMLDAVKTIGKREEPRGIFSRFTEKHR